MEERVMKFLVEKKEPENLMDFLSDKNNKHTKIRDVWTAVIDFGRVDMANGLDSSTFIPDNDSLAVLLDHANSRNQPEISELLQDLIDNQDVDPMDLDVVSSETSSQTSSSSGH